MHRATNQTSDAESAPSREKLDTQRQIDNERQRTRTRTSIVRQNSPPVVPPINRVTARTGTKVRRLLKERIKAAASLPRTISNPLSVLRNKRPRVPSLRSTLME